MSAGAPFHTDFSSSPSPLDSPCESPTSLPISRPNKRVSFALVGSSSSRSISPANQDLSQGLLASNFSSDDINENEISSHPLTTRMSTERLRDTRPQKYSSLSTDDDGPPPLESTEDHSACTSTGGHSHGSNNSSSSSSSSHSHSHGGGGGGHSHNNNSRSPSVSTPSTPGTPRRSPEGNCGGLKGRKKVAKAAAANKAARRQLGWAAVCCCVFMVCEVIGGFLANSLAIMTDAAHLLSDLAGFLISIFALWLATRPATSRLSFGFHRAEILGALFSVLLIWLLTGILVYEACWRLANPEDVDGRLMFIVAGCGLVVNGAMGMILMQSGHGHSHGLGGGHDHSHSHGGGGKKKNNQPADDSSSSPHSHSHSLNDDAHGHSHSATAVTVSDSCAGDDHHGHSHDGGQHDEHSDHHDDDHEPHEENMNIKAAFIHVIGDAIQSAGVMFAGGLIWYNPDWKIADPLCTFFFSILVLFTTTRLIRQSVAVLMEGVPEGIDPDDVETSLLQVPGVIAVHDLHIWSLSVGKPSLSVHLYCSDEAAHVLAAANKMCAAKYNIHHSTIQVERTHDDIDCNDNRLLVSTSAASTVVGQASLDRIATENFGALGINQQDVEALL